MKLKDRFQLTEQGGKDLKKASLACFLQNISQMLPMMLALAFMQSYLEAVPHGLKFWLLWLFLAAVAMLLALYHSYNATYEGTYRESVNLRVELANQLKELPLSYFSRHDLSDVSETLMNDVTSIEHALSHAIPQTIGLIAFTLLLFAFMLLSNWKMALAIILPALVAFGFMILSRKLQIRGTKINYLQRRKLTENFQEAVELQQEIKSYGLTQRYLQGLYDDADEAERSQIGAELQQAIPVNLAIMMLYLMLGLTVLTGAYLYRQGSLSLIYYLGFMLGAVRLIDGFGVLTSSFAEILYLDARFERIREIREQQLQSGREQELRHFDIELENVSFAYLDGQAVVDTVSLCAKQGEVTALVGPSGCGKTTLLRLMSRLYDYDSGTIRIDGEDIKAISTDSLFSKVSIVFQEVTLFNNSILENIRLGRPSASDEEVAEAAKQAGCDFIERLPEGIQTKIGENGCRLSGGERQRLSIARAILKNAPILFLDEISASLDVENEKAIQDSLNRLIPGKTVVIISHRLKAVENADKIVVMDQGRKVAEGKHGELLANCPLYRKLVERSDLSEAYQY